MATEVDLKLEQLNVKTVFLRGNLDDEIYMIQPESFVEENKKDLVYQLNKLLYGLKYEPSCWNSFIMSLGFKRCNTNHYAYVRSHGNDDFIILLLYVDDMLIANTFKNDIAELNTHLVMKFDMEYLSALRLESFLVGHLLGFVAVADEEGGCRAALAAIRIDGLVWWKCKAAYEHFNVATNTKASYAVETTAYVEKGRMKKMTGVKTRQSMVWAPIVKMCINGNNIIFKTPLGVGKPFPLISFMNGEEKKIYLQQNGSAK
ncbi:hypothetical protein NE237_007455 [Protea cynaroides]|uniref:Reverse transcriptase Ty1/copia-type domain-containing protein n=1 Tax=Protea cynaroides TaxID=273540 RepID=A0A9Q0KQ25_9MAGN|nr:hypothetical protein NE237_007455 [Protea cynaroides]